MSSATVRISLTARDQLRDLATRFGKPMQIVIEEAIDLYRRHCFLEGVNAAYADLRIRITTANSEESEGVHAGGGIIPSLLPLLGGSTPTGFFKEEP